MNTQTQGTLSAQQEWDRLCRERKGELGFLVEVLALSGAKKGDVLNHEARLELLSLLVESRTQWTGFEIKWLEEFAQQETGDRTLDELNFAISLGAMRCEEREIALTTKSIAREAIKAVNQGRLSVIASEAGAEEKAWKTRMLNRARRLIERRAEENGRRNARKKWSFVSVLNTTSYE